MASVNKVILIGNLGADPEVRYTQNNTAKANFRIATTEQWKDQDGNPQERTEWHRIVAWGRLGEICGQYLRKGKQVYVEGRLQTRQYDDKEGVKRYVTEIVCDRMQMLGRPGEGEAPGAGGGQRAAAGATGGRGGYGGGQGGGGGGGGGGGMDDEVFPPAPAGGQEDDDLPF